MGYHLDDVKGGSLSLMDLADIIDNLPITSAVKTGTQSAKERAWYSGVYIQDTLADLIDLLNTFYHGFLQVHSKNRIKPPKPYPRPWFKDEDRRNERRFGKGAVQIAELEEFLYGRVG